MNYTVNYFTIFIFREEDFFTSENGFGFLSEIQSVRPALWGPLLKMVKFLAGWLVPTREKTGPDSNTDPVFLSGIYSDGILVNRTDDAKKKR